MVQIFVLRKGQKTVFRAYLGNTLCVLVSQPRSFLYLYVVITLQETPKASTARICTVVKTIKFEDLGN